MPDLPIDQRRAILEREIASYVRKGYRVLSQTESSAQLVRPKRFNLLLAVLLLVLMVLPFVIYLLMYIAARDKTVYITVDVQGRVTRQ
jgi:hypothetical protein